MHTERKMNKEAIKWRRFVLWAVLLVFCSLTAALLGRPSVPAYGQAHASFALRSASFSDGGSIPRQYTCDGADLSPQLAWQPAPAGSRSFALVMDDPDASSDFTHWLLWNLSPLERELAEGASTRGGLPAGAVEGANDFGRRGYGGPCPPRGNPHRYFFTLYALDRRLDLPAGATRKQLETAMSGHVLAQGQIVGAYRRAGP